MYLEIKLKLETNFRPKGATWVGLNPNMFKLTCGWDKVGLKYLEFGPYLRKANLI